MSKKQKDLFLEFEANNWFERNKKVLDSIRAEEDLLLKEILDLTKSDTAKPLSLLEIGCGNGKRLAELQKNGFQVIGLDPSKAAIKVASEKGVEAKVGTADELPFPDNNFDILVFGFCLYLCDRDDLFRIASEANRVLKETGYLFILDFYSKNETSNDYHHLAGVKSYKMDYRKLFDWHPSYSLVKQMVGSHYGFKQTDDKNEWISISVLRKKDG
jgi:ubiquinone/menaquinone biosynthesis C-methylase UbiE